MRELYGLFLKMEEEETKTPEANLPPSVQKKTAIEENDVPTKIAPRTVLPAINKMKKLPTDLFEIQTSSFSASLNEKTAFTSKPEIILNGRE